MLTIIPKPTDIPSDNSTRMVMDELDRMGYPYQVRFLEAIDPFSDDLSGATIWACGIRQNGHNFESLQALSLKNRIINSPESIVTCASKVMTSALLVQHGVPTPATFFTESRTLAGKFIQKHTKAVSKPVYGFDGVGIHLVESEAELGDPPFYLQEYVPNDRDFRVFVIGDKAVGAIMRVSDHLTHNIHQGGCGSAIEVPQEMADIAVKAAQVVGVDYAGVDLLSCNGSYVVLEVNGTPNWHCMQAPIPRLLAEYLVSQDQKK
ncbi:ATP-grasp domain-containing protein [Methanospirillum hungatei]|jgi:ribosomal protein S6--L-glutamate ligase|uniref:ATP-grasp domain-containing protein n=1 Tax=Methanospirillum hungatei TaxID=2203 RepID=UPI0009D1C81A|nr:ATP-grasp domain-containing protein [Methanospirillum hungatei]MBP7034946.1 ATP-grasp domain-containing protein [Methanospirillum sp.]MBP9008900.1 ATP-grasp domain-containing protein [Methanospirillum sp.]OQA54778.1 MAG: Tetrahydromethanopterin:alpha-L-glutamate ligase [Euryarchaeota archaeon ADurb.Bin294]HOW06005.1 ATP-grasp domain-containing protein [Methanospirillum hungatei]